MFRSDNGGGYSDESKKDLCDDKLINHELTVSHHPEQNGIAYIRTERLLKWVAVCWSRVVWTIRMVRSHNCSVDTQNMLPNTSHWNWVLRPHAKAKVWETWRHRSEVYFLGYAKQHKSNRLVNKSDGFIITSRSTTPGGALTLKTSRYILPKMCLTSLMTRISLMRQTTYKSAAHQVDRVGRAPFIGMV